MIQGFAKSLTFIEVIPKWIYGMLQNQKDKNREDKTGFQNQWEHSKVQGILIDKNPNQEISNKVDT